MAKYNLIMSINIKTDKVLKITGKDAVSFVDSIVSNNINVNGFKPSYLLGPDGKIKSWFFLYEKSGDVFIYQDKDELDLIMENLKIYAIRIDCHFEIFDSQIFLHADLENLKYEILESSKDLIDWKSYEMNHELPSRKIIDSGLLPNETKWLEIFVDFEKGCFLGQEQASRIKYRGKPRRMLVTNDLGIQEMIKI